MSEIMKAQVIYQAGGPEAFQLEERPIPAVKDGWTLVQVKAFGLNHSEVFTREGQSPGVDFPRILGIECVGEVVQTTRPDLTPDQRVVSLMGEMGRAFDGSYAQYVLLPNAQVYTVDSSYDWPDLAAIPETFYTAYGSYKLLHIQEGDSLLIRAASGGVGLALLKLVKARFPHNRVVGSVRSLEKAQLLQDQGYDALILDQDGELATDETFDKVLELIGPKTVKDSLAHTREYGIVCSTGLLGGIWTLQDFDPTWEFRRNVYLTGFYSGNVDQAKISELFDFIETYQVPVSPERIFRLEELPDAHRYLASQAGFGKVVVVND